jgi:peptidoglycan/xylan/chitin deacetylase (PgdA/CDA1 family)
MTKRILLLTAVGLLTLAAGAWGLYQLARSRTVQAFGRLVARVQTADRVVALTFDDGPTSDAMDGVLRILESRHVRGTFFVNGRRLAQAPELGRRLVAAGQLPFR